MRTKIIPRRRQLSPGDRIALEGESHPPLLRTAVSSKLPRANWRLPSPTDLLGRQGKPLPVLGERLPGLLAPHFPAEVQGRGPSAECHTGTHTQVLQSAGPMLKSHL